MKNSLKWLTSFDKYCTKYSVYSFFATPDKVQYRNVAERVSDERYYIKDYSGGVAVFTGI